MRGVDWRAAGRLPGIQRWRSADSGETRAPRHAVSESDNGKDLLHHRSPGRWARFRLTVWPYRSAHCDDSRWLPPGRTTSIPLESGGAGIATLRRRLHPAPREGRASRISELSDHALDGNRSTTTVERHHRTRCSVIHPERHNRPEPLNSRLRAVSSACDHQAMTRQPSSTMVPYRSPDPKTRATCVTADRRRSCRWR
jgi:hypothetical protein